MTYCGGQADDIAAARAVITAQVRAADGFVVFGAGQTGLRVAATLRATRKPVVFADETVAKHGSTLEGLEILPPEAAAARLGSNALLVCAVYSPHVSSVSLCERLHIRTGLTTVSFLRLGLIYPDSLLPYYCFQAPEELRAEAPEYDWLYERLEDDLSRRELEAQHLFRLTFDATVLPTPLGMTFVPITRELSKGTVFVDCGAFDGDTIRAFLAVAGERYASIVAFEPDRQNFQRLKTFVDSIDTNLRDKIDLNNRGVWKKTTVLRFHSTGTQGSCISDEGDVAIPVTALDDADLPTGPLFIKFDVEGAEADALEGAKRVIVERRPVLAVSAYHTPQDIWSLARQIDRMYPKARLRLVAHGHDGADVMLYALP